MKNNDIKNIPAGGQVDYQEFSDVIISRLKEYSLATFERAFNDDRDGLRPVSRRTLYTMKELGLDKIMKKVQFVSGAVMKYHPYNSDTIADAITQLGQWFVKNYPYLTTQGNFGSLKYIKGYAAPRYIECKLNKFSQDCITDDIDDHCIPYTDNYDNTATEPEYLPTKVPLTLIQGGVGLGEAFINNIPPYNLGEVVDCCVKVIKNKSIPLKELMKGIYPDFPTGGEIINKSEIDLFQSLSADKVEKLNRERTNFSIKYRAKLHINRENNSIDILELPYRTDFDSIWDRILYEVNEKNNVIMSGIINHSDHIDSKGNIIFELICKKDANLLEIVDQLYIKTPLQTSASLSYILYCGKYLKRMSFKDIILRWYETQYDIIRRKFNFQLSDAQNQIHILEGLVLVYDRMDEVIKTIKNSVDKNTCITALVKNFGLSMVQARAISEMKMYNLTKSSKPQLFNQIKDLKDKIKHLEEQMENIDDKIIQNLLYMKEKYGRPRRTAVIDLKEDKYNRTSISISDGAILYSRDSVGIFDTNALLNSKSIYTSLKPFKLDSKNVKEVIGYHHVTKNITGTIVFGKDGTARRTKFSEIPITNNWVITNDQTIPITAVVPVYEDSQDSDFIVCINNDYKVKIFKVSEINFKKVQTGVILAAQLIDYNKLESLLIYNEYGEYIYIDKEEVPILNRSASGNITSFAKGERFNIIPVYSNKESNYLITLFTENDDGNTIMTAIDEVNLDMGRRTNKPKLFFKMNHSKFVGAGIVNANTKNTSNAILIGPYSMTCFKGKAIRDNMDSKTISSKPFGLIQIPENK